MLTESTSVCNVTGESSVGKVVCCNTADAFVVPFVDSTHSIAELYLGCWALSFCFLLVLHTNKS